MLGEKMPTSFTSALVPSLIMRMVSPRLMEPEKTRT